MSKIERESKDGLCKYEFLSTNLNQALRKGSEGKPKIKRK